MKYPAPTVRNRNVKGSRTEPGRILNPLSILFILLLLLHSSLSAQMTSNAQTPDSSEDLAELLEPIRAQYNLPALAAAIIRDGRIVASGTVGKRRIDRDISAAPEDKFHIGSCTKSLTATLAALMVEEGTVSWTMTVADAFPEMTINEGYRDVTLEQLLAHRGGVPADVPPQLWASLWMLEGSSTEQRMVLVKATLADAPAATPGTAFMYSNTGYAIAGAMLERVTGKGWEELMRDYLFEPLGMTSAGFGAPASDPSPDQPLGHNPGREGPVPVEPGPGDDNPTAIGPGATIHCSIADLARFARFHTEMPHEGRPSLSEESFAKLHTPPDSLSPYAHGWIAVQRPWADGTALNHAGSNTMFYAVMWLAPNKRMGVVIAANAGGNNAATACDQVAGQVIMKYGR